MSRSREGDFKPIILARIPQSRTTEVRVQIQEWEGKRRFDFRFWVLAPDAADPRDYRPTAKGIMLPLDQVPDLIAALKAQFPSV